MEKIKNVILILASYLTVCGVFYQLIFWSFFDINGLSFFSISNIITTSLYPITKQTWIFVIAVAFMFLYLWRFGYTPIQNDINTFHADSVKKTKTSFIDKVAVGSLLFGILIIIFSLITEDWMFLKISSLCFAQGTILLFNLRLFKDKLVDNSVQMILLFFLLSSAAQAIEDAKQIIENKQYNFILKEFDNRRDTLKYLGNNENSFYFTPTDNSRIIVFKSDTLTLYFYKPKSSRPVLPPIPPPF